MRTVDSMVTEDQRDVAVSALEQIYRQTGKVVTAMQTDIDGADLAQMMAGLIAVIRFTSHEAMDRVKSMESHRF